MDNVNLIKHKLVSYERTKADALQVAKEYEEETGKKCFVINPRSIRARSSTHDRPWQVREKEISQ